jgi:VWFA-related protein
MVRPLLVLAAALALAGPQTSPAGPGRLVHIEAVAVDGKGQPVRDLTAKDLEVSIENYRIPIGSLSMVAPGDADDGRVVVLLLDDMNVQLAMTPRVREIAQRFVQQMAPHDRMAVRGLNDERPVELVDAGGQARLLKAISTYTWNRFTPYDRPDLMGAHLLETVAGISRQIAELPARRKVMVGIGASFLFDAPIPPPTVSRSLRPEWTAAMRAAAFAHVAMYAIDPGGIGSSRYGGDSGFARQTGGHAFVNTNDFDGAVDSIMREAGNYYVIEVADPPVGRKFDLRNLEIRSLRHGVTVRARRLLPGTEAESKRH